MIAIDRMKASLFALIKAALPRVSYAAPRFARVIKSVTSSGGTKLDVAPDDPAFPSMPGVPLFHGLPGVTLTLTSGTVVLVEFSEMDPSRPFVRSWAGGEHVAEVAIAADMVTAGGRGTPDQPVKVIPLSEYLAKIAAHTHPETGTTTAVSATLAVIPTPDQLGATSVKVR